MGEMPKISFKDGKKYYFLLDEIHMYPLSSSEFMPVYDGWNEYISFGGIPLVVLADTEEQKIALVMHLKEIYIRDIVVQNQIRNVEEMEIFKSVNNSRINLQQMEIAHSMENAKEIALALNLSVKQVDNRLYQIKQKLREALSN